MTACRKILCIRTQIYYYTCSVIIVKKKHMAVNLLRVRNVKKRNVFFTHHIQFFFGQAELCKSRWGWKLDPDPICLRLWIPTSWV